MIGKLSGRIDSLSGAQIIVDVGGVGYVVTCSARTLRQAGAVGDALSLRIETQVREDSISLFGFIDAAEQDWFRLLTTVQGVGARVALSILGTVSPDQLMHAIAAQDKTALTQADGVGPKLALRLVTELKDKVPAFMASPARLAAGTDMAASPVPPSLAGDALSALVNLGYRRAEAFAVVAAVAQKNPVAKLDELIRSSLAELGRKDSAA
ncbi:MAG: Holliday junction branch migration protein RuvA [Alphaproteobacteria bacterium]|nr:Holliday junction branch migration protein RuvA [Alphaproteobacteria bacterium]